MLLHVQHQEITVDPGLVQVARNFVDADERKETFSDRPIYYTFTTAIPS